MPSAVALNGISYNIARSVGPAIGGIIVAFAGAVAAFATNAAFYLPLLLVMYFWKRASEPSRLPPERLGRAVVSGVRYIMNSPSIRVVQRIRRHLLAHGRLPCRPEKCHPAPNYEAEEEQERWRHEP